MKRFCLLRERAGFKVDNRGVAAVEFALVGLPLILLLFGTIECGRMFGTQNALQYAVEQAARYAIACDPPTTPCPTTSQIQSYAASKAYGQTLSSSVFSVTTPSCGRQINVLPPNLDHDRFKMNHSWSLSLCFDA